MTDQMPPELPAQDLPDSPIPPRADGRRTDPGSRRAGLLTLLMLIPAFVVVVTLQQCSVSNATRNAEAKAQEIHPAGRGETFGLMSRFLVRLEHTTRWLESKDTTSINAGSYMKSLRDIASSPADRVRLAIVEAEIYDAKKGREALDDAAHELLALGGVLDQAYVSGLLEDIDLLDRIYAGETLTEEQKQQLLDHHGWHARLALSFGKDNNDPERTDLIDGGGVLIIGLGGFGLLVVLALIAGIVLFIVLVVKLGTGSLRMHFRAPVPGGSVYLETFAVFVASFMVLQVLSGLVEGRIPVWAQFGLQWLIVLSIFWPLLRGVSFTRWRADMGFVAPRGVVREISAGLMVYLASVPVYFMAALGSWVLVLLREMLRSSVSGEAGSVIEPPLTNPVFEMLETSDVLTMIVLGSLVTLWAPLVEESIMRGALFRHLRSRMGFVLSALVSALLFGALHQYDVLMLLPVIALGASFAFCREWRGSIIGCMTAHALHNTTIFMLVAWLISAS